MRYTRILACISACAAAAGCQPAPTASSTSPDPRPPDPSASTAAAPIAVGLADVGLDPAAINPDADPCSDFYQYTCGNWLKNNEIPADKARYGRFGEIHQRNQDILKRLLEDARAHTAAGSAANPATAKLGTFYGACMDESAIEAAKLSGIQDLLSRARAITKPAGVIAVLTELHRHGIWPVFAAGSEADFNDSTQSLLFIDTAGLGLPDRDYYLKEEDRFAKLRTFYRGHVERMLALSGMSAKAAKAAAGDVMEIETALARFTRTRVERSDYTQLYNKLDRAALAELTPSFDWNTYFAAMGRPDLQAVSVTTPEYMTAWNTMLGTIKPAAWSSYLQWRIVQSTAPTLPAALADESFALVREVSGQPEQPPRWRRCINATDAALGELLGQLYVKEAFGGTSKSAAEEMGREIRAAFATALDALVWMDPATKEQARKKLEAMTMLIGYPDSWRSYDFTVDPKRYTDNVLAAQAFEVRRQMNKADKPRDRNEWQMTPQTVNAYYDPLANQMVFPAGILQPPFFGAERSVAANLGAIGMIVGHEITHGFDDSGAKFDDRGNMRNWWQDSDGEQFRAKGQCMVDQYNRFEVLPELTVNGELTLGENIADLGGVKFAYRAYRHMRKHATERYVAQGLTEDQQFFVAVGQAWCTKNREAEARRRIITDPHAPPSFRVNGALRNLPEFAEAFQCSKGTFMNPESTCEVW